MFIKICGITNIEDAQLAVNSGASALGFIFAKSKRQLTAETAVEIIKKLPDSVEKIGVFSNQDKIQLIETASRCGLTGLQLHGEESQDYLDELGQNYKILKSIKVDPEGNILSGGKYNVWKLLLDTYLPNMSGGTGKTFDWKCLENFDLQQIIVAGGLNPDNVASLLSVYTPFGVDVCSGLEAYPGKKDEGKMRKFFREIENHKK